MRVARPTLSHLFLCAFVFLSGVAVALGLHSWLVAILLVAPIAAVMVEIDLPEVVRTNAFKGARLGASIAVLGGLVISIYPVAPEALILGASKVAAHALVLIAGALLLARTPPGGGVAPAMLGALVAACLQPASSSLRVAMGAAFASLVAWLATSDDEGGQAVSLRPMALAFFVAASVGIAVATMVFLPWAQPQVEAMAARMISNDLEASTGLATESHLGDVERLAISKRVAMRLYGDRPADLRVRAFTRFDGRSWKTDPRALRHLIAVTVPEGRWPAFDETPGMSLAPSSTRPDGEGLLAARLVVTSPELGAMPAPAHTVAVKVEDVNVDQNPSGILFPNAKAALYAVVYADGQVRGAVEAAPGPEMLEVPERLDPRMRELAVALAGADLSASDRADRVVAYFQSGFRYSLNVGRFHTNDPVSEFVFDKKKGYCEYFATATTLLLRMSGVPARYVTGYAVRSFQRSGAHYVIRDEDAHAWSEAYLPGRGWVEVDATPASDYEALHGDLQAGGVLAGLRLIYDELAARFSQGGVWGLLRGVGALAMAHPIPFGLALVAFVVSRIHRRWRSRSAAGPPAPSLPTPAALSPQMRQLLHRIDALCAARSSPRPPFRAPREHVSDPRVQLADAERSICLRAVSGLYAQAYGGEAMGPQELEAMATDLASLNMRPRPAA